MQSCNAWIFSIYPSSLHSPPSTNRTPPPPSQPFPQFSSPTPRIVLQFPATLCRSYPLQWQLHPFTFDCLSICTLPCVSFPHQHGATIPFTCAYSRLALFFLTTKLCMPFLNRKIILTSANNWYCCKYKYLSHNNDIKRLSLFRKKLCT